MLGRIDFFFPSSVPANNLGKKNHLHKQQEIELLAHIIELSVYKTTYTQKEAYLKLNLRKRGETCMRSIQPLDNPLILFWVDYFFNFILWCHNWNPCFGH